MIARGIRNNNPGNIRWGDNWQGLKPNSKSQDSVFCVFEAPEWGIRALVKILQNYQKKYNLLDVRSIINRYAPPCENDTESYILTIRKFLGVGDFEHINLFNPVVMLPMLKAIITVENGEQPYDDETLLKGISLANS